MKGKIVKNKNAEIKKIVLDLGGKEVELSVDQAKQLHFLLDEMYGEKHTYNPPIIIRDRLWYWDYQRPIWTVSGTSSVQYSSESGTLTCSVK
jgi:hypothetical protein